MSNKWEDDHEWWYEIMCNEYSRVLFRDGSFYDGLLL